MKTLLIEQSSDICEKFSGSMTAAGYTVVGGVRGSEEAWIAIHANLVELVIIDVTPSINSEVELINQIKHTYPELRVAALVNSISDNNQLLLNELGADYIIRSNSDILSLPAPIDRGSANAYENKTGILVVEDTPESLMLLTDILSSAGYSVRQAQNGEMALASIRAGLPELILLDINMPHLDGFEFCEALKSDAALSKIPVIFISAHSDSAKKRKGFHLGACDFISKPFDIDEVLYRVKVHLNSFRQRNYMANALAHQFHALVESESNLKTAENLIKQSNDTIEFCSNHDALTQLPNFSLAESFFEKLKVNVAFRQDLICILSLGLDRLKIINDSLGYKVGDQVIQEVSSRLQDYVSNSCMVSRSHGDKFIILIEVKSGVTELMRFANKLISDVSAEIFISEYHLSLTSSIGVAICDSEHFKFNELVEFSEIALIESKKQGTGVLTIYSDDMSSTANYKKVILSEIRGAIVRKEFSLFYQPQVSLKEKRVVGAEALIRWNNQKLGNILPSDFIPYAEETGLIISIGEWVIESACAEIQRLIRLGWDGFKISINISGQQLKQDGLVSLISYYLAKYDLDPAYLELEITESILMQNSDAPIELLGKLKALGVGLALDDFGTGFSSLSYLKNFPIDTLKIDKSFIDDIPHNINDATIVQSIISLTRSLGMRVIAEGVELQEQLDFLMTHECDLVQGYYFIKPIDSKSFESLIKDMLVLGSDLLSDKFPTCTP